MVLVACLLLSGCGSSTRAVPKRPSLHTGVLRWGLVGFADAPTLDPALASDIQSINLTSLIYGGLVRLDAHLHVQPDGAARWTITHRSTVYTFYLRRTLRFADGRRVTASDVAAALERALGPEGSSGTAPLYLAAIATGLSRRQGGSADGRGIQVINRRTLRITLAHPTAHFLTQLAFPASYVPDPRVQQQYGASWTDHASGFGPFSVRVWRHSRYLTLQPNRYYYGGRALFRRIQVYFYQQPGDAVVAYTHHVLNLVSGLAPGILAPSGVQPVTRSPALAMDYLAFNTTRPPFRRLYARRAFAAVWSAGLAHRVANAGSFPALSFLPSALGVPVGLTHARGSALAYLARARYTPDRFPALALVVPRDPQVLLIAKQLQRAWNDVLHIPVTLRQLNSSTYTQVLNARDYDLAIVRWGGDYPDPQQFLTTQLGPSPDNVTGWTGKEYAHTVQLADTYDPRDPRRGRLFARAARMAAIKVPLLPLDEPAVTALIFPSLTGLHLTPLNTIVANWKHAGYTSATP